MANGRRLGDVLKRLRCEYCRAAPSTVSITDHPNDGDEGGSVRPGRLSSGGDFTP
jgi:hypothetical protein